MQRPTPQAILRRLAERNTVRVAVTGLRRCGKTVFTTSFVHNLMSAGQWPDLLPFLKVAARGDLIAAEVFPLPGVPMFPFERSLAAIVGGGATHGAHGWPAATDRLCGLRIAVRYRSRRTMNVLRGRSVRTLNIDLVDYPGEWLLDLPLLAKDFATWSAEALALAQREPRVRHFREWQAAVDAIDAQIVLVDVLGALKAGQAAFDDMRAAIAAILQSFDYSRSGFRAWLEGALTERVLFAATKADHVSSNQHPNLRRLLEEVVAREANRIRFRGVETEALAISSVRCTEDVVGEVQGQTLSLVRGMPVGRDAETALFPGEIPAHFPGPQDWREGRFRFLDFLPVHVSGARGIPHIGLDEAMQGLVGNRLR